MPNNNTPKRKSAKSNAPKRLATNAREWNDVNALVRQHVERLVGRYDDAEQAESFFLLLDLITSDDYDPSDRWYVLHTVRNHAFTFTDAFETAQKITLGEIPQGTELRMVA